MRDLTLDLSRSSCCRSTSGGQYSLAIPSDPSLDPELHPNIPTCATDPDLFLLLKCMSLLDVLSSGN